MSAIKNNYTGEVLRVSLSTYIYMVEIALNIVLVAYILKTRIDDLAITVTLTPPKLLVFDALLDK